MWELLMPLLGAGITAGANIFAADTAANATRQAQQMRLQGAQTEAGYIGQGQQALSEVAAENAPGQNYLRSVVAGSNDLTPEQRQELADLQLAETNQLRGGPLSGSGRATAAMINDSSNRFVLGALDRNRARAYNAASAMANRGFSAEMGRAQDFNAIGSAFDRAYSGNAADTTKLGTTEANAITATGKGLGTALGNIGAQITKSNKLRQSSDTYDSSRPSAYTNPDGSGYMEG